MDHMTLVMIATGVAIALMVAGLAMALTKSEATLAEQRLLNLTSGRRSNAKKQAAADSLLRAPPIDARHLVLMQRFLPSGDAIKTLYEQADLSMPFKTFVVITAGLIVTGGIGAALMVSPLLAPVGAAMGGGLALLFLHHRKRKRVSQFMASLPEAVELMGRALRAGHGLASGMQLVSQEMKGPVSLEFGRVFEEQNLGVPLDEALRGMSTRIPTMDVRFLVTAIIIQRATGGDLAEILDKIGRLIRQRFELFGHVKALTAEGRLSGLLLLAMPPSLLAFITASNPEYASPLFHTPLGTKLLAVTVVLQLLGAVSIKKIISIKV